MVCSHHCIRPVLWVQKLVIEDTGNEDSLLILQLITPRFERSLLVLRNLCHSWHFSVSVSISWGDLYVCCSLVTSQSCRASPSVLCCRRLGLRLWRTCAVSLLQLTWLWRTAAVRSRLPVTVLVVYDWQRLRLRLRPCPAHDLHRTSLSLTHIQRRPSGRRN